MGFLFSLSGAGECLTEGRCVGLCWWGFDEGVRVGALCAGRVQCILKVWRGHLVMLAIACVCHRW